MKKKLIQDQLSEELANLEKQRLIRDRIAASNRAMSITVGTAFGGTTEVSMRGDAGQNLWCLMQPVEVIELIHQLAANVGCHIALKPRADFASWRDWRQTEEEKLHMNGWAPFVNDMAPFQQLGAKGMDPEVLQALNAGAKIVEKGGGVGGGSVEGIRSGGDAGVTKDEYKEILKGEVSHETLATQKPIRPKSTKRTSKAA
jgi:hypothetical protein